MASPGRRSRRRAAVSFERSQLGDAKTRDNAGGDISTTNIDGADPDNLVHEAFQIIRAVFLDDTRREARQAETDRYYRWILLALALVGGALLLQTAALIATLAALVSLLWPRLSALVW